MQLLAAIFAALSFITLASCQNLTLNTTQAYYLRTDLKPGQPDKARFDGLYLYAYHTGAGMNDAVFAANKTSYAAKGFLNATTLTDFNNQTYSNYSNQEFDLGNPFPWTMYMSENTNFYAAWEPVRINAGSGPDSVGSSVGGVYTGFFINDTGLQWTNYPGNPKLSSFGGWLGNSAAYLPTL